jgi:hypothetical protein
LTVWERSTAGGVLNREASTTGPSRRSRGEPRPHNVESMEASPGCGANACACDARAVFRKAGIVTTAAVYTLASVREHVRTPSMLAMHEAPSATLRPRQRARTSARANSAADCLAERFGARVLFDRHRSHRTVGISETRSPQKNFERTDLTSAVGGP